ncbi:hypothetical protein [Actinacidiphila bryophytorum]|uniref:hypothetical protein n=1 Tax=Actinacidiphila bryophytorum TaxID=1436133 RepID=UPI002176E8E9|nr:hypothetical protein [Actinacidiphila bryophytorum]UWE07535.1 hypothetical protein NYE86_01480 [Actinacidiphila bryophytorum]
MNTARPFQFGQLPAGADLDALVAVTFGDLSSQFMNMPRGGSFVEYADFRAGYEALRMSTRGFAAFDAHSCWQAMLQDARAFLALRAVIGVTPPEWGDLTRERTGVQIPNGAARTYDGAAKKDPGYFARCSPLVANRVRAMVEAACDVLRRGVEDVPEGAVNRLDKFDTREGVPSISYAAEHHVPYAVLLYERFLGRPFAGHRDAVSESVGDVMESAIEALLTQARIPFRKTRRAERVPGFEQAPDFFVPDEISPRVVIEAKITGDDGTARDKVARILRLGQMRDAAVREGRTPWQLVACIDGRGFGVRKQDMRDLLTVTRGKVFTLNTLDGLVPFTDLAQFAPPSA